MQNGDKETIVQYYPTATANDSLILNLNLDSVKIEKNESDGAFNVQIADGIDLTIARSDDGTMTITKSHGLFAYETSRLDFARQTGQYKPEFTDTENAKRMADTRFLDQITENIFDDVRNNVSARAVSREGRDYWEIISSVIVTNNNDFDLGGNDYEVSVSCTYFDRELMRDGYGGRKNLSGKPISAHSSVTYSLGTSDMESGLSYKISRITITSLSPDIVKQIYTPTGTEYDDFVKEHGEPTAVEGDLTLNVSGLMGNCGTQVVFNGTKGTLTYNPKSTSLEFGNNSEQRTLNLVSYDKSSGKLVLQVRKGSTVTGNLDGTYNGSSYKGNFKNVNGNSSTFSFN